MGLATRVTMRVVVTIPLMVTLSLASELKPPPLPGTLTGMLLWSGTSVMGLTRLSAWWKGSNDSSDGWMTLHICKWRCKLPLTRSPAWCTTSLVTLWLTLMLKSCKYLSLGGGAGCPGTNPCYSCFVPCFSSYLITCLVTYTAAVIMSTSMDCFH
jgi:hypothetical protein